MPKRVAITGFSFRFPSTDIDRYWQDLLDGRDLVTEVDPKRWSKESLLHPNKKHPGSSYTFSAGSIGDISLFDAGFFGISPREASLMDPQQRLLLEMSWEAMENSGIKPSSLRGSRCGVFIGIASADYSYRLADDLAAIDSSVATGNTASIAANRISYFFDLCGPSMALDTACSSSMVAFHQACRSIISGESSQSIAGGISLHLHPYGFLTFSKASMLSSQGRCRVFDASGDGYVRSEGGGVFFLKDYDQALSDGNPILAVVANSVINTDGRKTGLTVPSQKAQTTLLKQAYAEINIDPAKIDYLEAHGTGTAVGDPVEAKAIGEALGQRRQLNNPLLIGSVKSNIGHLETASGVAGLVKALYCIQHRMVPATIGLQTPNPHIPFSELNIAVVTKNRALKKHGKLVIGVNSFGFGGANAHIILESHEQPKPRPHKQPQDTLLPIVLSAKDEVALKQAAREFSLFLKRKDQSKLYDVAYNTALTRDNHEHRLMLYGTTTADIADDLLNYADGMPERPSIKTGVALKAAQGAAFIYSGNGTQWQGMGKQLLAEEPLFRKAIEEVDDIFRRHADFSLVDELAGENGDGRYTYTEIAQPALFALQVGITQMLRHRGLYPAAVAGHSVGEVAAAWAAGALTLEAAIEVIFHRSQLQGTTKGKGAMTAIGLGQETALALLLDLGLWPTLTIAGVNSSRGVTVAGSTESLNQLEKHLSAGKIFYKRLDIDYAFHSLAMNEIETGIRTALAGIKPRESLVPFYSTVTGNLLEGRELNAEYWWNNIRKPVLFEQAIKHIVADGTNVFMEVGPHPALRSYINGCLKDMDIEGRIVCTAANRNNSPEQVWKACTQTMLSGAHINWQDIFPCPGRFIQLPNYPWQRERHWHPVTSESFGFLDRRKIHPLLGYALKQHELTWENQLDTKLCPTMAEHVVGDATVLPGTGYVELVLAAALAWHPAELAEIEGLEIFSPILLGDNQTKIMRLSIDEKDGSVTIKARDLCSKDPWTLHSDARILSEPQGSLLRQELPLLPTRHPDFTGADHDALTRKVGLMYGPAFQCINYGWVEENSAFAVFKIPESIEVELDQSHLHPAILDCTFQLIIQLLQEEMAIHEGITFVPTRIGRIAFRATDAKPAFAKAMLLRRAPHSLTAEFTVFDIDGTAIAIVKDARFRSIRLGQDRGAQLSYLDYHGIPKPHTFNPGGKPVISFRSVQSALIELAQSVVDEKIYQRYSDEVDPLLDILCTQFTREALEQLSVDGRKLTSQELVVLRTTNPEIAPFLDHLLAQAEDDQSIARTADAWEILPNPEEQTSAQDIWLSMVNDYPDFFNIIHSVGRVGMHLRSILTGKKLPAQLSSRNCTLTKLASLVFGAVSKQRVGKALRDLIALGLKELPEGRRLGIVEISKEAPSFALDACAAMDFNCCDYVFVGTSRETLETTAQLKERFPGINTHLIDTSSEQPQRVAVSNLAIVTLDFTSPEEAMDALDYARNSLTPGGSLIVIGHHPSRWVDFVFGAERIHWFQSNNGTWLSNQCAALFWQQQLQQLHFTNINSIDLCPDTLSGPYILCAQLAKESLPASASRKTMPRSWVLLADKDGLSTQLSDKLTQLLQSEGDMVVQACPGDTTAIAALLLETTGSYGQLDGIIYLAGLGLPQEKINTAYILERQVERCATAAAIIQACEATQTNTTCWLITTDAATELLPRRLAAKKQKTACICADAALWGFGRTLINEASTCDIRLVDLEAPFTPETFAKSLIREFAQTDNEQEIVLTAQGERYVPRLTVAQHLPVEKAMSQEIDSPTIALGFQIPGRLRNLRWEASPCQLPLNDEVEVEVHATGLNFRDIMYTLGLLPDEAVENGFAGATLGLEFSGIVTKVGESVQDFAPGDKVVGFGPSSFSNRVVTKAGAIAHIPAGIAFEAATTIPSTFFTAYYALHYLARLQPGEKVLIHGAAGGVGLAAIQLATWIGAEIYVTAGSDEKRDFLSLLGIERIYHSRSLSFADEILAETNGEGVDVVLNSLAGEAINRNLRVLKPFGRFLELGKRDFYENTKIGLRPFRNNISYFGIDADQLMQAQPALTRTLFTEVMALFLDKVLHPLPYHVFDAENIVEAFRYMQQARQIGKIVVTYRNGMSKVHTTGSAIKKHLQLKADASYLVTGGLAGFGLRTAEWLVSKGARSLVLISRSGPRSEEAKSALDRLEKQGVTIHADVCDVTDKNALSALLTEISGKLPPLRGIVHAATVINDGLISNMNMEQIRSVLAPKALGAYNLHELTLDMVLDYFILFSSATTLFGNPGQGNYVAANSCLDSLARNRRAAGLAATCVRWGAIEDVGFLARNEKIKDALQARMGGAATNSAVALAALEEMLASNCSGIGVMDFDWRALSRFLPSGGTPKFSELAGHAGDRGNADDRCDTIQQMVEELSDTDLAHKIVAMIMEEVGEILQVSPDKIDPTRSMYDMGLDSLMGVELVVALESRFGTRLPVMALSQSPTVAKLTEFIIAQLKGNEANDDGSDEKEILTQAKLLAVQHATDISDDSITQLAEDLESRDAAANDHIIH